MILQMRNIDKSFGLDELFDDLSLEIKSNEKIALVGANGVGKTTLFRILEGKESYDNGSIFWRKNVRKGFLEQIHLSGDLESVEEFFAKAYQDVLEMEKEMRRLEVLMATDHSDKVLNAYDRLQSKFLRRGGYSIESELMNLLTRFNFDEDDLEKDMTEFSGGQITRLAFVRLLLSKPDILFLDEPTNHLDIATIEWLESYLMGYDGTVVLISHDRLFLDRIATAVIELEDKRAYRYEGNYSESLVQKAADDKRHEKAYTRQQKEIKRLEKLIQKFGATASKASFAKSKQKYLDRMDVVEKRDQSNYEFKAEFKSRLKGGKDVLRTENLSLGYDHELFKIDLNLQHGRRYAVMGDNGSGKSTLLKTVAGRLDPLSGEMLVGHQIEMAYFDQQLLDFSQENTVLEEVWDRFPDLDHTEVRQALARFLFQGDDVFKPIAVLSGGERVRLSLVKLMLAQDNFLVLDEPTNHLDIHGKEALEKALLHYDGTMLVVSHDRYFIEKIATDILLIKDGHVYHSEKEIKDVMEEKEDKVNEEKKSREDEYRTMKYLQSRKKTLEEAIQKSQIDLEYHRELRFDPDIYHDYAKMEELNDTIDAIHNEIKGKEKEWEEVSLSLEED